MHRIARSPPPARRLGSEAVPSRSHVQGPLLPPQILLPAIWFFGPFFLRLAESFTAWPGEAEKGERGGVWWKFEKPNGFTRLVAILLPGEEWILRELRQRNVYWSVWRGNYFLWPQILRALTQCRRFIAHSRIRIHIFAHCLTENVADNFCDYMYCAYAKCAT